MSHNPKDTTRCIYWFARILARQSLLCEGFFATGGCAGKVTYGLPRGAHFVREDMKC